MESVYRTVDKSNKSLKLDGLFTFLTTGTVVDTNDPQQNGRLRIMCPAMGDTPDKKVETIPWALYVSPLAGSTHVGPRGPDDDPTKNGTAGPVAYGMWNIPKVGALAIVACIDGDPNYRIWLGCLPHQWLSHTMPHGRYTYQKTDGPDGPLSSAESPIQPLYDNQTQAFTSPSTNVEPRKSFEFATRAMDQQVSGIDSEVIDKVLSNMGDDLEANFTEADGREGSSTQGYQRSRIQPNLNISDTGGINYDPQVYAWTTPGFHSISMGDAATSCRMRFRTSSGNQIILDDTNERIYISTAQGKNWIEMDQNGNIDIYSDRRISIHAALDINFETEGAFRVKANKGIHLSTNEDFRIFSKKDIHHKSENIFLEAINNINELAQENVLIQSVNSDTRIKAGGDVLVTGSSIHLNGPDAGLANPSKEAFLTNRVPQHEPWGRVMYLNTDKDTGSSQDLQFSYNDPLVGRVELNENIDRGPFWHR